MLNDPKAPLNSLPDYARKFLKEPPTILKDFHYEDVMEFLNTGSEERYVSGDIIFNEDDIIKSALLLVRGNISLWVKNIEIQTLSEGAVLGDTFLFMKFNKMTRVQAESDVVLLRFERYDTLNFFRKRPEKLFNIFTKNIIENQQRKIQSLNLQVMTLKKRLMNKNNW